MDPGRGAAEVTAVVRVVDRCISVEGWNRCVLGRRDEVLPRQVAACLLQQVPQRVGQTPQCPLDVVVLAVVGLLEVVRGAVDAGRRCEEPRVPLMSLCVPLQMNCATVTSV